MAVIDLFAFSSETSLTGLQASTDRSGKKARQYAILRHISTAANCDKMAKVKKTLMAPAGLGKSMPRRSHSAGAGRLDPLSPYLFDFLDVTQLET